MTTLLFTLGVVLIAIATILAIPAVMFSVECLAAVLPPPSPPRNADDGDRIASPDTRIAVIIPAHNEQLMVTITIRSVRRQLRASDLILVVADNCSDATAAVARQAGATVIERIDANRRGKGFALQHGLQYLSENQPPDIVVFVDADCELADDCLRPLVVHAVEKDRPIQSRYLMHPPQPAMIADRISALAVLIKNYVRPRGLERLGMPCLLTGSGMAIPWHLLQSVPLPGDHIVEDLDYSIDLALAGFAPIPQMRSIVTAELPSTNHARGTQRTRWEHGHLKSLLRRAPRLLIASLRMRRPELFWLFLELSIPPIGLTVVLQLIVLFLGSLLGWLGGGWTAAIVSAVASALIGMAILMAWVRFGRDVMRPGDWLAIPRYLATKVAIYRLWIQQPQTEWIKTERTIGDTSAAGRLSPTRHGKPLGRRRKVAKTIRP